MNCEIVIYQSEEYVVLELMTWTLIDSTQSSPILEPYRSALRCNSIQHAVTRAEYQEIGSEASRRKFRSVNLRASAGASVEDGAADSDRSAEHERKNSSVTRRKMADEKGTTSGKAATTAKNVRTGSTRQSTRETTSKRR